MEDIPCGICALSTSVARTRIPSHTQILGAPHGLGPKSKAEDNRSYFCKLPLDFHHDHSGVHAGAVFILVLGLNSRLANAVSRTVQQWTRIFSRPEQCARSCKSVGPHSQTLLGMF